MHVYLAGRHFELTDAIRDHVERKIVEPLRNHTGMNIPRVEIQLEPETDRGAKIACHVRVELKGQKEINIREVDNDLFAAIDLASGRVITALTEHRDRLLTLSRHPKKYSLDRIARALGIGRTRKQA